MTSAAEIVQIAAVGASEVAGVIGVSPWTDRWQIYASRRGLIKRQDTPEMRWGRKVQRQIAEIFTEDRGLRHEWSDKPHFNPTRRYQRATVDAFIPTIAKPEAILEIKTTGLHLAGEWEPTYGELGGPDGIPDYYLAQVQWQMDAHGLPVAYIAVSIAGPDVRYYRIPYDPEVVQFLRGEVEPFWAESLMGDVEPEPGTSEAVKTWLKRRYPKETEKVRQATAEEIPLLDELAAVRAALKPLEDSKDELEVKLKKAIGDAEGLDWPRGRMTWKATRDSSETDWEALAKAELDKYPEDVRKQMIAALTTAKAGSRRIHFAPWRRAA